MNPSSYRLKELDASLGEGRRLDLQAQAFVELELPSLLKLLPRGAQVADFGCGTGVISRELARQLPDGRVTGLDPDAKALEYAASRASEAPNFDVACYGVGSEGLPAQAPFDAVICRLVLLHLPDPAAAIAQMARCLKKGGLLYLVDCDEDYDHFSPVEPWQDRLVAAMKQAQAMRGGSRTLGSKLPLLCRDAGLSPEGCSLLYYSTENLGAERWRQIFVPKGGGMAGRDLQFLVEQGRISQAEKLELEAKTEAFLGRPESSASLATWHAWARKR